MSACEGERYGPMFVLILDTGLRPGEAIALTWADIDFAPATLAALNGHRKAMLKEGRDAREGVVFCDTVGGNMRLTNLHSGHFKPLARRVCHPALTPYSLRHTRATLLLLANVNPKVVSERLGHSSVQLTLDTYAHVLPTMQRAAADVMAKLLAPPPKAVGG